MHKTCRLPPAVSTTTTGSDWFYDVQIHDFFCKLRPRNSPQMRQCARITRLVWALLLLLVVCCPRGALGDDEGVPSSTLNALPTPSETSESAPAGFPLTLWPSWTQTCIHDWPGNPAPWVIAPVHEMSLSISLLAMAKSGLSRLSDDFHTNWQAIQLM